MEKIIKEHTFFDEHFNDEIVVVDLGACRGEFINELAKEYKIKKAILVEAGPANFRSLEKKENYVLYNRVISSEEKKTFVFHEDPNSPYNGSMVFNHFGGVPYEIQSLTLKEIMEENGLDYVDILKIDIEGSEYDILMNTEEELLLKMKQITVEFHDFIDKNLTPKTLQIFEKFENMGFTKIVKSFAGMEHYDVIFYKK